MSTFKSRLAASGPLLSSIVCTIPSATVPQALAAAGADSLIIDMEHGAVDWGAAHAMIAATQGFDCAPLIRISRIDEAEVKRVLDLGAEGICFPLVNTADDAARAIATLHYPPRGTRGFGPFLAHSRWNESLPEHAANSSDRLISMILAETVEAVDNIEAICATPGIDVLVPAQFDLSSAMGIPGQFDHPDFQAALAKIEAAANAAGLPLGGVALGPEQAKTLTAKGYRVMAGFDVLMLKGHMGAMGSWTQ